MFAVFFKCFLVFFSVCFFSKGFLGVFQVFAVFFKCFLGVFLVCWCF